MTQTYFTKHCLISFAQSVTHIFLHSIHFIFATILEKIPYREKNVKDALLLFLYILKKESLY